MKSKLGKGDSEKAKKGILQEWNVIAMSGVNIDHLCPGKQITIRGFSALLVGFGLMVLNSQLWMLSIYSLLKNLLPFSTHVDIGDQTWAF